MPYQSSDIRGRGDNGEQRYPGSNSYTTSNMSRANSNYYPPQARQSTIARGTRGVYHNPSVVNGYISVAGRTRADTVRTRTDIGRVDTRADDYDIGMVVKIPHIVPTLDPREPNPDHRVPTRIVGNVCPKIRWAIVVAVYEEKLIVLPVYSSHGRGLMRKSETYRATAMSIVNEGERREQWLEQLTPEVLCVEDGWQVAPGAHINLNEPLAVSYSWPIKIVEELIAKSTTLLRSRYDIVYKASSERPVNQLRTIRGNILNEQRRSKLAPTAPAPTPYAVPGVQWSQIGSRSRR